MSLNWEWFEKVQCKNILVLHTIIGCHTNTAIYSIGKGTVFIKLILHENCYRITVSIYIPESTKGKYSRASNTICENYKERHLKALTNLTIKHFVEKVVKRKTFLKLERLPPTESALKYHHLRAHNQIQEWIYP